MHEVECSVYEAMNRSVVHFCKLMSSLSRINTDVGSGMLWKAIYVTCDTRNRSIVSLDCDIL